MATTSSNHLQAFFDGYPEFTYNPSNPATSEFNRMARLLQWSQYERNENKDYFKDALVKEFNTIYGTDENSLESWQTLCRVLNITPVPETLKTLRSFQESQRHFRELGRFGGPAEFK
ncbi:hypothetical protein Hypma_016592 [Hypsizygus marmoreus]|uniref:Uncharacterized protein n=1 Tax=Hypsizygus marmoreus TaxID=39966 RepID=A0A369IZH8_HYPMA|nr:hypothetical protein Hypma_016592 [Hypsizygus marmoreus]